MTTELDLLQAGSATKDLLPARPGTLAGYAFVAIAIYMALKGPSQGPTLQSLLDWMRLNPLITIALILAYAAISVSRLWLSRKSTSAEEIPSFSLERRIAYADVLWTPILLSFAEKARNTVRVTDPLCPKCWAPLFYLAADPSEQAQIAFSAECPTCGKTFPFKRGLATTKEMARRHAIGLSARKQIFQSWPRWMWQKLTAKAGRIRLRANRWVCARLGPIQVSLDLGRREVAPT